MKRSVTASQSMGLARPPLTRRAAFFFACCSTKRSSSATHASSAALLDRLAALSCDRESAGRFAGMLDDGGGRWGGLSPLRPLRSHGGGLRDDMLFFLLSVWLLLLLLLLCVHCAASTAFAAELRNSAARDVSAAADHLVGAGPLPPAPRPFRQPGSPTNWPPAPAPAPPRLAATHCRH